MAAYATAKILYISIGFWFILSADSYNEFSNHALTVRPGGSVTIPCHYNEQYAQLKKHCYLETDKYTNTREKNLLVIDHPDQSLFTVNMRNLRENQSGLYFCVVETGETGTVIYQFYLKVQYVPAVSVMSSSVSGHEGDTVSVQCFYSSGYKNEQKRWCRYKDQKCFIKKTNTSQSSSVQISDDGENSFTVLMTGLRLSDSGWYFCSVGNQMIPVQLTVTEAESVSVNTDTGTQKDKSFRRFCLSHS
ncbi:polymeric immunoglobulin receptor-like [Danio rerio]|uniref:polymeric immunoglobulin receptor-like n=1 Tax=Danio rerio TaxID=7955 RepID=UPI003CE57406